jgi:hypothetical protein
MFRRLAALLLLIPLSLNGLWMVCENGPDTSDPAPVAAQVSPEMAHCKTMCPTVKPAQTGSICLVSANGDGHSIAVFAFALTVPSVAVNFIAPAEGSEFPAMRASIYSSPTLFELTPPPKA